MKTPKQPFILYFVAGMVPTSQELAEASKLRARVGYRNASAVQPGDSPEPCEGVAGKVPESYKKCPTAEQAIATFDKKLEEAAKAAASLVDKPRKPGQPVDPKVTGSGAPAPKGFENLPGGDGSVGAPAAPAATGGSEASSETAPAADADKKPPAWGSPPKK